MCCQFDFNILLNGLRQIRKVIAKRLAQDALRQVICNSEYLSSANLVAGKGLRKLLQQPYRQRQLICEDDII